MNSQNDVFSLNKYNDALLAALITADSNQYSNVAAWFAGGYSTASISSVQLFNFASDTANANLRGNLPIALGQQAGANNLVDGWVVGGQGVNGSATQTSNVQRIAYAADTALASLRGYLVSAYGIGAGMYSLTGGWFACGNTAGNAQSTVQKITYATDTAVSVLKGNAPVASSSINCGVSNATNGWFPIVANSSLCGITYATDTSPVATRGNFPLTETDMASTYNSTNGWFAGGAAPYISNVQKITYATDTASALLRGNLPIASGVSAGLGNNNIGWISAGYGSVAASQITNVQSITYATDTTVGSIRGNLLVAVYNHAAA